MKPGQDNHGVDGHGVDRIDDHNRLQLSALMDGELPLDEARFLLRRLQHDSELGDCWERWQFCGDLMRGRADIPLPAGFADRIAAAIATEPGAAGSHAGRPRWVGWGSGAALAASIAVVALFVARQSPVATVPAIPATPVQVATETPSMVLPVAPAPTAPDRAAQLAAAVAVADVARRMGIRRSRPQIQRTLRVQARVETPTAIAANAQVQSDANGLPITLAAGVALGTACNATENAGEIVLVKLKF